MGIGGEYAAINSAIDELIPAQLPRPRRHRGQRHVLGRRDRSARSARSSCSTSLEPDLGWRIAFLIGPVIGIVDLVPAPAPAGEPALAGHARPRGGGREDDRRDRAARSKQTGPGAAAGRRAQGDRDHAERARSATSRCARVLFQRVPEPADLGATLMITQSFLYNAIFFTYTLVLAEFYDVAPRKAPLLPVRVRRRQPARPVLLGHLFDTVGRQQDDRRHLHPVGRPARDHGVPVQRGRAHRGDADHRLVRDLLLRLGGRQLRVPDRQRDLPAGGAGAGDRGLLRDRPVLRRARAGCLRRADRRGRDPTRLFDGYLLGAGVMVVGGIVAAFLGVAAEGKSLEDVATPLAVRRHPGTRAEGSRVPDRPHRGPRPRRRPGAAVCSGPARST